MIRIREFLADPEVFLCKEVQTLRAHLFRCFVVIFFATDGAGRFRAEAAVLRAGLFGHALGEVTERDVKAWLVELHARGLIKLYTEEGVGYGKVTEKYWRQRDTKRKVIHPAETRPDPGDLFAAAPPPREAEPPSVADSETEPPPFSAASELNRRELKKTPNPRGAAAGGERILYFSERLFATMAELEGSPIEHLTPAGRRAINSALAAIRIVKPDLHPADLERAAAAWRKLFPTASLTARAMATHWAKLHGAPAAKSAAPIVEEEPMGWRDWINENTPDVPYARGGEKEGEPWHDLPGAYRRFLIEKCRGVPA